MRRYGTSWFCMIVSGLLVPMAVAASAQTPAPAYRATIKPSLVRLAPGATQQFKIVIRATRLMAAQAPGEVSWSVNDVPGGNAALGTIDSNGVYTAPANIPSPREIHIVGEVPEAANRFSFATVIMGDGPPAYKSVHVWAEPVVSDETGRTENMLDPHGIAIDPAGNLLIADQRGSKVLRYSKEGQFLGPFGKGTGSEPGQFTEPRIIAVDPSGRIFVSDSKGDRPRIQVFSPDGQFLQIFAEKGMQPGMILRCHGMDFDQQGRLFTSDVDNMRTNVYSADGEFLFDWGKEGYALGEFNAPHGCYVDRSGDVFITGYYGPTQKFSPEGEFIVAFAHGDPPDGPVYFHNVSGDKWGNVYVMVRTRAGYQGAIEAGGEGPKRYSIMKYNNNGDLITGWAFTTPEHNETTAVVDNDGRVYALFKGKTEMGVETFEPE
jgi:DNA-binding beta-propeller fold protein YncE